jgi:hypothetical protein
MKSSLLIDDGVGEAGVGSISLGDGGNVDVSSVNRLARALPVADRLDINCLLCCKLCVRSKSKL